MKAKFQKKIKVGEGSESKQHSRERHLRIKHVPRKPKKKFITKRTMLCSLSSG